MSSLLDEAELINQFLCKVKESLPLGIRLRKSELKDILDELEEHIWEKAIEIADERTPNEIDIQIALSHMGSPEDIAKKFVSKSTPYVYISEELYPIFKKYRKIVVYSFIFSIVLLTLPFSIINSNFLFSTLTIYNALYYEKISTVLIYVSFLF